MRSRIGSSPLYQLTLARLRELIREPEAVFWVFVFPVLLAVVLGLAFRERGPEAIPVGVVEGAGAEERVAALEKSPHLLVRRLPAAEAGRALFSGRVLLLVEPGDPPAYRYDPSRSETLAARLAVDEALQRAAGRESPFDARELEVTERGGRYIDWLVPGLVGMNLMGTGMWAIGFALVMARKDHLLKRFVAAPMRRSHFLGAQLLARGAFLVPEVGFLVLFAVLVLGVPFRGSFPLFAAVCALGGLAFVGLGLLVAARPRTIEGVSGLMNLIMVPMWVLSGIFFSTERFPDAMQPFVKALPLTALNDALRAVMLDGGGLPSIGMDLAILLAWAVLSFVLAVRFFRWQ
jgi:ABC-2 type transport system permease protein